MKKIFFFLLALCFAACQKKIANPSQPNSLITQAQNFFNGVLSQQLPINGTNYRANQVRNPEWNQAKVKNLSVGLVVEVPIHFEKQLYVNTGPSGSYLLDLNAITKLVLFQDSSGQFHYQVLTFIPDSNAITNPGTFTGIMLAEDWRGNSLASPMRIGQTVAASGSSSRPITDDATNITTCSEIDGYNYASDDPDDGYGWSESTCTTYGFEAESGGDYSGYTGGDYSGLASSGSGSAYTVEIAPPTSPIGNIADYFKCFTNVGGSDHTYTVTLAVEQPDPGSRAPWGLSGATGSGSSGTPNPVTVGHAWLILTETTAYGSTTRNVGFYPTALMTSSFPASQGILNDDEATVYNIALTVTVNNVQFFNIINFILQGNNTGYQYNLNTNNCTTFALNALHEGGVEISTTQGIWIGGSGDDPGDLGQDLRSMPLASNMSLITATNYHPNVGSCN